MKASDLLPKVTSYVNHVVRYDANATFKVSHERAGLRDILGARTIEVRMVRKWGEEHIPSIHMHTDYIDNRDEAQLVVDALVAEFKAIGRLAE